MFEVIKDTREQQGWEFHGMSVETLKTGDYTLRGYEDVLAIERKGCISELASNLSTKWTTFEKELVRLEDFPHPFIICEFTLDDLMMFPHGSGIPKYRWSSMRIRAPFLLKRLLEIEVRFKVKIIFAGKHGKEVVSSLFKRIVESTPCPAISP